MQLHKVVIDSKKIGSSTLALERSALDRLLTDWRGNQTAYTDYKGFLWLGDGEIVRETDYTICLRPSHITTITVDGTAITV